MNCNLCNIVKNDDEFAKYRKICKKCYYQKYKEYLKEYQTEYHKTDKYKEYQKKYEPTEKRKENQKIYKNTDKYKEYKKQYKKEYNKCRSCHLFQTNSKRNYLCSYCSPNSTKRQKTKELQLKNFLEKYYSITHNKKVNLNNSCNTYYPDFLIDCNTFFICVECDENSHKSYNKECELIRMNNITYSLGLPTIFLRFNPDKKGIKLKTKQIILKSYIDYYTEKKLSDNVIEYLFY